jgi:hypothetical protein
MRGVVVEGEAAGFLGADSASGPTKARRSSKALVPFGSFARLSGVDRRGRTHE